MKILALNTTSINSYVALQNEEKIDFIRVQDKQSEKLLVTIDEILNKNNLTLGDIDCYAVNVGPGSFTGIRIGLATIKAFLFSQNKKCVVLNSFDLLSYNIKDKDFIVMLDSGNKDFYYAEYSDNKLKNLSNIDENTLLEYAKSKNLKVYASSDDKEKISSLLVNFIDADMSTILNIASSKIQNGEFAKNTDLCPLYIKKSQAENSLNENIEKNLTITKCENYKDLINIENECFETPWTENMLKEEFSSLDRYYYVAKVKNENVGYIGAFNTGDGLNILKLAVIPRFRNLSIGKQLVEKIIALKNENNIEKLFLEVDAKNEKAIKLYTKCGFECVATRKKYYANGNDCLVMFLK